MLESRRTVTVISTYIFRDRIGMINTIDPFRHQYGFLLANHSFGVLTHNIIQSGYHSQTLRDFRVHCTIYVVQKSQGFADQFITLLEVPLMDFILPRIIEVIRVRSSRVYVLHYGKDIENVFFIKNYFVFRVENIVSEQDLYAGFEAKRS